LAVVATMSVVVAVAPPPNIVFILADGETAMHSSLAVQQPCTAWDSKVIRNHFLIVLFTFHRCVHTTPAHSASACSIRMPPLLHLVRPHHSCTQCLSLLDPYASIDSPRASAPCTPAHSASACSIRMPPSLHLAHSVASCAYVHASHPTACCICVHYCMGHGRAYTFHSQLHVDMVRMRGPCTGTRSMSPPLAGRDMSPGCSHQRQHTAHHGNQLRRLLGCMLTQLPTPLV
jgi:hypothetical protein